MNESNENLDTAPIKKAEDLDQSSATQIETSELSSEDDTSATVIKTESVEPAADQEQVEQQIAPEQEQEQKKDVINTLIENGVDEKIVEAFKKMSHEFDFPQFVDHAMSLFPEIGELLTQFKKIDEDGLPESDKNNEKAQTASNQFNKLTEKMGLSFSEGEKRLADLALKILATSGKELAQWFGNSWENSDLARLIDAVVMGADYNSTTSLGNLESKEGTSVVSVDEFFNYFKKDSGSIAELLKLDGELGKKLNWKGGAEILSAAKNKNQSEQKMALQEYLLKMYEAISSSPAENLVWEQANILIAKEIFKKDILSSEVLGNLKKMNSDNTLTLDSF